MQNAYEAGLIKKGDSMTISVTGKGVCDYCQVDLSSMAKKTGLGFMTVVDRTRGRVYYWRPGMDELQELGRLPK